MSVSVNRSVLQLLPLGIAGWHMKGAVELCTSDCSRSNVGGDSLILKNCNSSHQFVIVVRAGG